MKNIFRYITIAAALLATAVNAGAQYNYAGGVGTSKTVTQNDAESYTIRLETFATGTTTVTETSTPVNVVLVLDVSGSMAWPKGDFSQTSKTTFSYNDIVNGNVDYFRTYSGYHEQIFAEENNGSYYLYVSPDGGTGNNQGHYLDEEGNVVTGRNNAASSTDPNAVLVTTYKARTSYYYNDGWDNRSSFSQGLSRIHALRDAVCDFIDDIEKNDLKDKDGNDRSERLHNKIAIVKFAGNGNNTSYNTNETIVTLRNTEGNVASMKETVRALMPKGATQAGQGMSLANTQLQSADVGANKVVVMFTDGEPSDDFAAITQANTTKGDRGATVYTIGTFTEKPSNTSIAYKYLNAVSSNYGSDVTFSYNTDRDGKYTSLTVNGTGEMKRHLNIYTQ